MTIQADDNVPFTGGRPRYLLVDMASSWVYHKMAAGVSMSGAAPRTASVTEAMIEPTVSAGRADFDSLSQGGLFTHLGGRTIEVEAIDNQAGATITIVSSDGSFSRPAPTSYPFEVGAGEYVKATGGSAGGRVGVLSKLSGERFL